MNQRVLVTGADGCIGAWVVRRLVEDGSAVTTYDIGTDDHRWRWVMSAAQIDAVDRVQGDITDLGAIEEVLDSREITQVIHLAALQVPFCRADPPRGAFVNVGGTTNVFEAVRRRAERIGRVVYASSIAVYNEGERGPHPALDRHPQTVYGVYKRANEGTAHVYWADHRVSSIGLRPHTVYGPGRDQGMTSTPTAAMLAAAAGRPYRISFGGAAQMQHAADAAAAFVAAARSDATGATVHNLPGECVPVQRMAQVIAQAAGVEPQTITHEPQPLPFPDRVESSSLAELIDLPAQRSFDDGVRDSIAQFRELLSVGAITPSD